MRIYQKRKRSNKIKLFFQRLLKEILVIAGILFILNSAVAYAKTVDIFKTKTVLIELNADVVSRADTVSDDKIDVMGVRESQAVEPLAHIVDKIFILESSGGKKDSCHRLGLHNDFGFGIYGDREDCYDTTAEVREKVSEWFENKLKSYSMNEALCGYNTGSFVESCKYVELFNSLSKY